MDCRKRPESSACGSGLRFLLLKKSLVFRNLASSVKIRSLRPDLHGLADLTVHELCFKSQN